MEQNANESWQQKKGVSCFYSIQTMLKLHSHPRSIKQFIKRYTERKILVDELWKPVKKKKVVTAVEIL